MKHLLMCSFAVAISGGCADAAPLDGLPQPIAERMPMPAMLPFTDATVSPIAVLEPGGLRFAGMLLSAASLDAAALRAVAELPMDTLKILERAQPPLPVTAGLVTVGDWDFPILAIAAFVFGMLLLTAGAVFGGALWKLSLAEARKNRGMRRRYAP